MEIIVRVVVEHEKTLSEKYPVLPPNKRISNGPSGPRKRVIKTADGLCCWCRKVPATTVDHIFPLSRGGTNSVKNLVGSCHTCNQFKGDALPKDKGMKLRIPLRFFDYV